MAVLKFLEIYLSRPKLIKIDIIYFKSLIEEKKTQCHQEDLCLYYGEAKYSI